MTVKAWMNAFMFRSYLQGPSWVMGHGSCVPKAVMGHACCVRTLPRRGKPQPPRHAAKRVPHHDPARGKRLLEDTAQLPDPDRTAGEVEGGDLRRRHAGHRHGLAARAHDG